MGIADDLQKLEQLRSSGALTDGEFTQAKTLLLSNPPVAANPQVSPFIENQLKQVKYQNELARIDREWEIERRQYQIVNRYGKSFIPTFGMGIATAVVGGIFGVFWTAIALTITNASEALTPGVGKFGLFGIIFPLIGVIFTLAAIGRGIYCCILAQQYNEAYAAYQDKHRLAEGERGQE
jgi:hypothetical protein